MKRIAVPAREPSRKVGLAAVSGEAPGIVVQDDFGGQVFVTPKMAREIARQLPELADVATGKMEPDLTKGEIQNMPQVARPRRGYVM